MAKGEFDKKRLEEIGKLMAEQGKSQTHLNESLANYASHLKQIAELQQNITHTDKQRAEHQENYEKLDKKILKVLDKITNARGKDKKALRALLPDLEEKLKAERESLELTEGKLIFLKKENDEYRKQAKEVNKTNLALKEGHKFLKKTPGLVKQGFGKLKGTGIFDMEKSIRMAGMEMGIMSSSGKGLGKTIEEAAWKTQSMGVGVKELAKMQASYSTELGRSTQLSQEGLEAMGEIAAGTMLGAEGAGALVAEMDRFNISATDSRDIIQETVNMAATMGVNSTKVLKELQNNLKMANKYHFKGGVKGMASMAAKAAKLNISMGAVAGMSDELFNIEGAVEMSARLNTMGGEWAKLGDPMKLMYMARNDMEGLQDSVANATAGMADFNEETGDFSFGGLELHRMKELAKITNISAEDMAEMAKSKAKFAKIDAQMGGGLTAEQKSFVESTAVFKDGEYKIKLEGREELLPIKDLNASWAKRLSDEQATLKERADATQTFDDTLSNVVEQFKQLLVPLLQGINKAIPSIRGMMDDFKDSSWVDKIKGLAKSVGEIAGKVIGAIAEFPKVLLAVIGGSLLLDAGKWILNGLALSKGFLMGTGGRGGVGGSGSGGFGGSGARGPLTKAGKPDMRFKANKLSMGQKMMGGHSKFRAGSGAGMAAGMGMGIAGSALKYGRGQMNDPNSTAGQAMGIGGSALQGAGMGMMLGPWGALAGGALGAGYGAYQEHTRPSIGRKMDDGIIANGTVTPIDSKDKVFEVSKPGGAYDKASQEKAMKNTRSNGGTSKIHISFDPIIVKTDGASSKIDLEKDTTFLRDLSAALKKEMSKAVNNGTLSPNPT